MSDKKGADRLRQTTKEDGVFLGIPVIIAFLIGSYFGMDRLKGTIFFMWFGGWLAATVVWMDVIMQRRTALFVSVVLMIAAGVAIFTLDWPEYDGPALALSPLAFVSLIIYLGYYRFADNFTKTRT